MVTYCKECAPSCEFCIYAKRQYLLINEIKVKTTIEGCNEHSDEHHQSMARGLGYCKDFHCGLREENNGT